MVPGDNALVTTSYGDQIQTKAIYGEKGSEFKGIVSLSQWEMFGRSIMYVVTCVHNQEAEEGACFRLGPQPIEWCCLRLRYLNFPNL